VSDLSIPAQQAVELLLTCNHCPVAPVTAALPFPYHWVPGHLRTWIANRLFKANVAAARQDPGRIPATYCDNRADRLLAAPVPPEHRWTWPGGKGCAMVLSHDTDTAGQSAGIALLTGVADKRKIRSTISFVGSYLFHYESLIAELSGRGFDVALHDVKHDNRIAFLDKEQIKARLQPAVAMRERFHLSGFRSPSWYTSLNLWGALTELGFLYDMSVLDTWSFFQHQRNYGVATFYPFMVNNLVIFPNTIPFEMPWMFGYKPDDTLSFWRPKFDFIARTGGLIMFNAHPDPWFCGNPRAADLFARCVDYVLEHCDPACLTAASLADHVRNQRKEARMKAYRWDSVVVWAPQREAESIEFSHTNPCMEPDPYHWR